MKVVVVIPSRYGSTRFEGKPLALIQGKPMIQRVYEIAAQAEAVADIVVATDDRRIAEAVRAFNGKAVMTGAKNRSGTDRVAEAADKMALAPEDVVVNIQGDQPAFVAAHITEVTGPFVRGTETQMSTLAYEIDKPQERNNPKDCKVVFDRRGYALYFSRSPIPFARDTGTVFSTYKHLGIYAYRRRFLEDFRKLPTGILEEIEKLEQLRALENGYPIQVVISRHDSPEVDVPEDIPRIIREFPQRF